MTQEPDLKIRILKALAEQVYQQDCHTPVDMMHNESEVLHNMLEIIKML